MQRQVFAQVCTANVTVKLSVIQRNMRTVQQTEQKPGRDAVNIFLNYLTQLIAASSALLKLFFLTL